MKKLHFKCKIHQFKRRWGDHPRHGLAQAIPLQCDLQGRTCGEISFGLRSRTWCRHSRPPHSSVTPTASVSNTTWQVLCWPIKRRHVLLILQIAAGERSASRGANQRLYASSGVHAMIMARFLWLLSIEKALISIEIREAVPTRFCWKSSVGSFFIEITMWFTWVLSSQRPRARGEGEPEIHQL